jgi:hypothetical protein
MLLDIAWLLYTGFAVYGDHWRRSRRRASLCHVAKRANGFRAKLESNLAYIAALLDCLFRGLDTIIDTQYDMFCKDILSN